MRIFPSLILWIPAFVGMTALAADPPNEAFFPTKQGTTWVYKTIQKGKNGSFDMNVMIEGPWKETKGSGMIMTQKDKRGTMRQFLIENEKGVFIDKLALSKALTPEVNTRFT